MVVKPSAYDSVGKPPRQAKKNLLGGLAGRLKRNGVRKESSSRADEVSFDGSLSYNGAGPSHTAISESPFDERSAQPSSRHGPEKIASEVFADDRQDESESRLAASASQTTSSRPAPRAAPNKAAAKSAKPKQTLVITSRKALYDPEVRAEVTRLYNLIHRVNSGPSAATGGKPMYASTSVAKSNRRYGTKPSKKLRSSFLDDETFEDDSFGKRPPRKLRVIKCPLADKGGNPFDKEELSSIGSVLGSSKVASRMTPPSRLSSSVLRCLGVESDPSNANHKSLAQQPEEESGVRVSSEEAPLVEAPPDPSPAFCGLFNLGSPTAKADASPHQQPGATPVPDNAAVAAETSQPASVESKKSVTFLPCLWSLFEDEPKETLTRLTMPGSVDDVGTAPSQATRSQLSRQGPSYDDIEQREENFLAEQRRDDMSVSSAKRVHVEERQEWNLDVITDKQDGTSELRDVAERLRSEAVSTPEIRSDTCSSKQRDRPPEQGTAVGRQNDRIPQPTSSTSPRGSFSWFRRHKKPAASKSKKTGASSIIYLNAPREGENEDRSEEECDVQQEAHCPPVNKCSTVERESDDDHVPTPSGSNERSSIVMESETSKESGDVVTEPEAPSLTPPVFQKVGCGEPETTSTSDKSKRRHSFKRTPSLISVKSLRTLVSTTSGCGSSVAEVSHREDATGREDTMAMGTKTSKDASRLAESSTCQVEKNDCDQNATSNQEKGVPEGVESNQSYLLGYLLAQHAFQREGEAGSKNVKDRKDLNPEEGMTLSDIMHLLQKHHTSRLSKDYLTYILAEFARHACTVDRAALQKGYVERLSKRPAALQAGAEDAVVAPDSLAEETATVSAPAKGVGEAPVTSFSQESSSYRASKADAASGSCTSDVASVTNTELGDADDIEHENQPSTTRWSCFRLGSCCGPVSQANSMTNEDLDDIAAAVETTIDALRGDAAEDSSVGSSDGHSHNDASEHDMGSWFDFLDGKEESYYSSSEFVDEDAEAVSVASEDVMHPSSTLSQCY
jgi:hypothetical protein